ncbi:phage tail protein, partial [Escherichia albertii]|nr:phage tail protein [Escherichia albertii]
QWEKEHTEGTSDPFAEIEKALFVAAR